jgi:MFS family permease
MFVLAFAISMVTITVPFVHIGGFARDIGLSDIDGAVAVSIVGLFALVGSMLLGALSDRVGSKAALALALGSQVIGFILFWIAESAAFLNAGAVAFGFFYGGVATLFPSRVGDLFGSTHAGAIGGFIFAAGGLLGAWGPALTGYLRDVHGDFRLAFLLCVFSACLAFVLFMLLPRSTASSKAE